MHESLNGFLERVQVGYIRMVEQDDLILFNYTDACTFDKAWDEYTMQARGIIFEKETGICVARPFGKFFNYGEHQGIYGDASISKLMDMPHYIQEKMDGSLGIIYWWNGKWNIATRGSFTSDQAIRGAEIMKKYKIPISFRYSTILVEIIYPENKIIVPYGSEEKLVLLACRSIISGDYSQPEGLTAISELSGMPLTKREEITIRHALEQQSKIPYTNEGWVVVFEDGTRLKIKGDDYMRIAKFKANLSPLAVWEAMSLGRYQEMAIACPEEIRDEFDAIHLRLLSDCKRLNDQVFTASMSLDFSKDRKTIALQIQTKPEWMRPILFGKLSKGAYNIDYVWKLLRPKGNEFVDLICYDSEVTLEDDMIYRDFGYALDLLRKGKKVSRGGWNGKGLWISLQKAYPDGIPINKNTSESTGIAEGTVCVFRPYLMTKSVDNEFVPWVASQSDLLAEDWDEVA